MSKIEPQDAFDWDRGFEFITVNKYTLKQPPESNWGKKLAWMFILGVPICAYISKYIFFAYGNQGPLGPLGLLLLPLFAAVLAVAAIVEVIAIAYGLVRKDAVPALGFLALFLVAVFMPLLPLPPSDTEQHFYDHRAEYEEVVAEAKHGQLPKHAPFFAHVAKDSPLVVLFNPSDDSYIYIAYAEKRDDLYQVDACYYDGGIHSQIGDTWWLCFREWN